jgi:hypothetical protein
VRPPGRRVAEFDTLQWRALQQVLLQQKLLSKPVDISSALTFEFLQDVYRKPLSFGK